MERAGQQSEVRWSAAAVLLSFLSFFISILHLKSCEHTERNAREHSKVHDWDMEVLFDSSLMIIEQLLVS